MIIVDTMEVTNTPEVEPTLKKLGIEYKVEKLERGDYTNDKRAWLVERKKADFWNVQHTISQLDEMSRLEGKKYLFIEGTRDDLERYLFDSGRENAARILNWGWAVMQQSRFQFGVEVSYFKNLEEMFKEMYWMDRESGKIGQPIFVKSPKQENPHLTLMCSIKKIGPKVAQLLLDRFGTPVDIFMATDDELLDVKGIGPETVKRIREHSG